LGRLVKYLVSVAVKPVLVRYLSETRTYRYRNLVLQVPPEVFHPGFFSSTRFLLRHLSAMPVRGKKLLELGAGSGLISIVLSRMGALVTATDINEQALETLRHNARDNEASLRIRRSDLFENLEGEIFDIIAINPPYYKGDAKTPKDHAWYCGLNGEYFQRLFADLSEHIHSESKVLMVLCDGCDLDMIRRHASAAGYSLSCVQRKRNLLESQFLFEILPV
jgi:release factor glutamine methyltransferase